MNFLAKQLKPGGHLYVTINAFEPPNPVPQIDDATIEIIPNIPPNADYDLIPNYYGVVIEKKK